jgi:hypothetical protein
LKRYIILLLVALAVLSLGLELATRRVLPRLSQVGQRLDSEQALALQIRRTTGEPIPILIVGNSLLGSGVNPQVLDDSLRPEHRVVRFVVEDTNYLDWYYGLHRLFREGARPKTALLMMNARQLASSNVRGDIFGRVLFDPKDALKVKHDSGSDNTTTSSYIFARASDFYGFRSEIRKWFLVRLLADFPDLTAKLRPSVTPLPPDAQLESRIQPRLAQLATLCAEYGAEFMIVLPPDNDDRDGSAAVRQAAKVSGIPVLAPFGPRELPPSLYSDSIHLNPQGAAVFTRVLGNTLRNVLQEPTEASGSPKIKDSSLLTVSRRK